MKLYRIIRLDWTADEAMSAELNMIIDDNEEVVQMSCSDDELVVLVASEIER